MLLFLPACLGKTKVSRGSEICLNMWDTSSVYVSLEPFDLSKFPVGPIQANHVAVTIVCSGSSGYDCYRLEIGPKGRIESVKDGVNLFESDTLDGIVFLTHSSVEGMDVSDFVFAGRITTLSPCSSNSLMTRIDELWRKYNSDSYQIHGTQYGESRNCRDFVRLVLVNLTSTDNSHGTLLAQPNNKWGCVTT